ncbi:MAG: response regulator [Planctomycetota bacterium]|jgi:DNA-binding response OmpR family regulator
MSETRAVVLYVDDDQDYLDAMRVILESAGLEMVEANSAESALRALREQRPDVILADLMMEEVDAGISFVREVRARGGAVPIIMISSVGDNLAMQIDASELGLAGVLQKPVDPGTIVAMVRSAVASV